MKRSTSKPAKRGRCCAKTAAGKPCSLPALGVDRKCLAHSSDPAMAEQRRRNGSLGGKRGARPRVRRAVDMATVAGMRDFIAGLASELEASKADVVTRCSAAARLVAEARALLEVDVETELEQLKRIIVGLAPHLAGSLGVAVADEDGEEFGTQ